MNSRTDFRRIRAVKARSDASLAKRTSESAGNLENSRDISLSQTQFLVAVFAATSSSAPDTPQLLARGISTSLSVGAAMLILALILVFALIVRRGKSLKAVLPIHPH
jgi:hypothetical protein